MAHVLRTDGVLSVLVRNRAGEVLKEAVKSGDWKLATANLTAETVVDTLYGNRMRLFAPADLHEMLVQAGFEAVAEHGVRVFFDYLAQQNPIDAAFAQIFELESKLGARARILRDCALHSGDRSPFPAHPSSKVNTNVTLPSAHSALPSGMVRPASTKGFALGLGLTNECNLACSFCYRVPGADGPA